MRPMSPASRPPAVPANTPARSGALERVPASPECPRGDPQALGKTAGGALGLTSSPGCAAARVVPCFVGPRHEEFAVKVDVAKLASQPVRPGSVRSPKAAPRLAPR